MRDKLFNMDKNIYNEVKKTLVNNTVSIFGAGPSTEAVVNYLEMLNCKVDHIYDNDIDRQGEYISGIQVISPMILSEVNKDHFICVVSQAYIEIEEELVKIGFNNIINGRGYLEFLETKNNLHNLSKVMEILSDNESKYILNKLLEFRATYNFEIFKGIFTEDQYYPKEVVSLKTDTIFVDGGAYNGASIIEFIGKNKGEFKEIYSFEPDKKNFKMMKTMLKDIKVDHIQLINKGLSSKTGELYFNADKGPGSRVVEKGEHKIEVVALDDYGLEGNIFIKMDIEGEEINALKGAMKTIKKNKPQLAICIYHKTDDLWKIPLFLKQIVPEYKIYIRHHAHNFWETVCYAVL